MNIKGVCDGRKKMSKTTDKTILLKYLTAELTRIENRNPNYINSKKWQQLKQMERKTFTELQDELEK